MINWQGVFPAVTTKFHQDGSLDFDTFFKNIDAQLAAGVHGIILGGTLGESSVLRTEEKYELTKRTIDYVAGRVPVVMNIAEGSTQEAILRAQEAEDLGAAGLMLLPAMRYPTDARETLAYFTSVAQSTELPIMIYNNPVDYKTYVTLEIFDKLLDACPNVEAVKESTRDVSNVTRMVTRYGDRMRIMGGVDTLALEALLMGAHGWVAGLVCAFPAETVAIYRLVQEGRIEEARTIYRWFLPLLELDIHAKLVQYIKLAEQMTGIGTEYVRAPRLTLIGEERERVTALIQHGLDTRPTLPTFTATPAAVHAV